MADPTSANDLKYLPSNPAPKRNAPNVSSGWVVMLLSGLVAAVLFLFATQQSSVTYNVAAANRSIQNGQVISPNDFRVVKVNLGKAELNRLLRFEDRNSVNGYIAAASMQSGDLILKSQLAAPATKDLLRAMSIPVDQPHAVAGAISVGDRVDVIDETVPNPLPQFVAVNLQVIAINGADGGSALTGSNQFSVTVAIDPDAAERVALAIKGQKFEVLRSTAATPLTISPSVQTTPTTAVPK